MRFLFFICIGLLLVIFETGVTQERTKSPEVDQANKLQVQLVINSLPSVKFETDVNGATKTKLKEEESTKNLIKIIKAGGNYFWATREYRPLIRNDSGLFTTFVCPKGGGYVKVAIAPDGKFTVMEHITFGMVTITYFGNSSTYNP